MILASAPWPGTGVRITAVRTFLTAPQGSPYLIVRVETSTPGLYGLGCVSDPQRTLAVRSVIDNYLGPTVIGRDPADIEDIHRLLLNSGYWRGGSIEGNALAGIDVALWDIKAKTAGMPLFSLLGGRVREYASAYTHVDGSDVGEIIDGVHAAAERGFRHIRVQVAVPGTDTYGAGALSRSRDGRWDSLAYLRFVPSVLSAVRSGIPDSLKLLHDVHERLPPAQARSLLSAVEELDLFFLEDLLAPEDASYFPDFRASPVPLAMGELFHDVTQFLPLIQARAIDFARIRIPTLGGLTPVRKLSKSSPAPRSPHKAPYTPQRAPASAWTSTKQQPSTTHHQSPANTTAGPYSEQPTATPTAPDPTQHTVSTIPEHCVDHSDTMKSTFQHHELPGSSLAMPQQEPRHAGMCISVCCNGGHGHKQRWTRCVGTCITVCRNGGHGRKQRWTRWLGRRLWLVEWEFDGRLLVRVFGYHCQKVCLFGRTWEERPVLEHEITGAGTATSGHACASILRALVVPSAPTDPAVEQLAGDVRPPFAVLRYGRSQDQHVTPHLKADERPDDVAMLDVPADQRNHPEQVVGIRRQGGHDGSADRRSIGRSADNRPEMTGSRGKLPDHPDPSGAFHGFA
ncbi:hypothetical protein LWC34_07945 [Kibdelosporangium philippinense]|uniref:Mandelate racemase/muconate lactonizing enzyme C-terminal domain-containing protein n=1 Tax=Kibdelosporangium philippinense TaxID=211113 RepID=A0ABS8Z4B2_9PSEU|nr:enolase C-terminal domain-like protein [Kibdelosporangium philippinense]MCE7002761.1 hypothetical protein [Kibdelosporangium philippinense]